MKYFLVIDGDGFVARFHICPDDELAIFLSTPDRKIEVEAEEFAYYQSKKDGRFWVEEDGSLTFKADRDNLEIVMAQLRFHRDVLLAQSDWTQLPDVPIATKEAWAVYRQALRDITLQADPFNIVWPVAPA